MVEWSDELLESMKRFRDETGMTYEQMKTIATENGSYSEKDLAELAKEGIESEEIQRELILRETLTRLTSDESLEMVNTLQEKIGFTPQQLVEILKDTHEELPNILDLLAEDYYLKRVELMVQVGNVSTDSLVDILSGEGADNKLGIIEMDIQNSMFVETFPNFNWDYAYEDKDKYGDVELEDLDIDDPVLLEIAGEPKKQGFADKVRNSQSDEKSR